MTGKDEREERRRYVRKRQRTVFTVLGVVMLVMVLISSVFLFHIGGAGLQSVPEAAPNYGQAAPCAPTDKANPEAKYLSSSKVTIRVLNGTPSSGFAQAVGDALANRGFAVNSIGNYSATNVDRTIIYFGKNAISDAYTVNSNFTDAMMVMDDRTDKLVDIVLGSTFKNLRSKGKVPAAGSAIDNIKGCKDASAMTSLPKAIEHPAVK
jgi:hypothetical protein